jgi:hypothetical protein
MRRRFLIAPQDAALNLITRSVVAASRRARPHHAGLLRAPLLLENSISYSNSKATVGVKPMPDRGLLFTITPNPERLLQVR